MKPEDVPEEWAKKAASGVWEGLFCPPPTDAVLRHALAAVIPLVVAAEREAVVQAV